MVALKGRAISRFVSQPDPGIDAVLVYGPDRGLVAERLGRLIAHFASDPDDPFATSRLDEAELAREPGRLAEELGALAFGGGRRTVVVRAPGGSPPAVLAEAAGAPRDAVLIVEGGELRPAAPLRKAFEAAKTAAALPCYADGPPELEVLIDEALGELGQSISVEAKAMLVERLGPDRLVNRAEIEKLSLYAGPGARIQTEDVIAASADSGEATIEAALDAMGEGAAGPLEAALMRVRASGIAPAQLVRAAGGHLARLHLVASARTAGATAEAALSRLRPPLHFSRRASLLRQLSRWTEPALREALATIGEAERDSRSNAWPSGAVVERTLFRIARRARAER